MSQNHQLVRLLPWLAAGFSDDQPSVLIPAMERGIRGQIKLLNRVTFGKFVLREKSMFQVET